MNIYTCLGIYRVLQWNDTRGVFVGDYNEIQQWGMQQFYRDEFANFIVKPWIPYSTRWHKKNWYHAACGVDGTDAKVRFPVLLSKVTIFTYESNKTLLS
jgi:hypothetical protein